MKKREAGCSGVGHALVGAGGGAAGRAGTGAGGPTTKGFAFCAVVLSGARPGRGKCGWVVIICGSVVCDEPLSETR